MPVGHAGQKWAKKFGQKNQITELHEKYMDYHQSFIAIDKQPGSSFKALAVNGS